MSKRTLLLAGIAALTAVPAGASVTGFRLPPGPTGTPTPTAQGPVDPDVPAERPRPATPTPTPAPRATPTPAPRPTSAPTATPVIQRIPPSPTPSPRATQERPGTQARPSPTPASSSAPAPAPAASPTPASPAESLPLPAATPTPTPAAAPVAATEPDSGLPWGWIGALAVLLAALGGAAYWLKRRGAFSRGTVLVVPDIERPRVPPKAPDPAPAPLPEPTFVTTGLAQPAAPDPAPAMPAEPADAAHPLHIVIEPLKLTQTMMNLSLAYRLELTNRGAAALDNLVVAADLVGAHASLPREAQLAGPESALREVHRVASLAPGGTVELKGELRLPIASIVPIQQGQAVLAVPLARFRASSDGASARCFTVVVGEPAPSGAIQPHRLDLGLRSVAGLTGRAF